MISMDVLTCALAGVVTSSLAALPSVLILRRVRRLERQHQADRLLDADTPVPLPKSDDDPPPLPVPVAIAPAPSPPKLAVVREDDPPPIPVSIQEPAPSLLRLYKSHPEHCDCDGCLLDRRIAMDVAQAQTLGLLEDLRFLRQGLKTLRLTLVDEIDFMSRRIAKRLDAETT